MVGAPLRDQYPVPVLQAVDVGGAQNGLLKKAFIAGHQDGKRGERNALGNVLHHRGKGLAVRDHHGRRIAQAVQCIDNIVLLHTERAAAGIQNIAYHLLLGKDQPALGRGLINGDDQYDLVPLLQKI